MIHLNHFLLPLFLSLTLSLQAQNPHPAWRNYITDHGLPSTEVHCILQDSKGYMWFGTDNGVSRFDGYNFQNFGAREGLKDNVVFELLEDRQGRVWMNTMGGRLYYFQQDSIYAYVHNDTIQQYRSRFHIAQRFYVDREETVYICLTQLGILKIRKDGESELFQSQFFEGKIVMEPEGFLLASNSSFHDLDREKRDSLIRLMELRGRSGPVEFLKGSNWIQTEEVKFQEGNLQTPKLYGLGKNRYLLQEFGSINLIDQNEIVWQGPFTFPIISVWIEKEGAFLITLNNGGGLRRYTSVEALQNDQYEQYLEGQAITRVYQDRTGGYWVASTTEGLFYTPNFDLLIYDEKSGLSNAFVTAVEPKGPEELFIGLYYSEVYWKLPQQLELETLPLQSVFFQRDPIYDLYYDLEENVLWVGKNPLQYFDGEHSISPTYIHPTRKIIGRLGAKKFNPVMGKKILWITSYSGINQVDLKSRQTLLVSASAYRTRFFMGRVLAVLQDFSGQVWLGMEKGLYNWNDGDPVPVEIEHPAFQVRVEDIAQMPDSTLVIGTKGQGVVLWKGDQIRQFTRDDGLTADMIENTHIDEAGQIWVGTLNGLNKFRREEDGSWTIEQMTTAHGLPSDGINMVKTWGNRVWVATNRGLAQFDDVKAVDTFSRTPIIRQLFVNEAETDQSLSTFTHRQNNISLHFLTIDYRQNARILYRYRLNPAQEDWVQTQNTSINYSALLEGSYTFEVQSRNADGFWSDSTLYSFVIRPPFWRTGWFLSLLALGIGLAMYRLYKYRTGQIRREAETVKQLSELERSALRAQMNPHFIFNCLTSISNFINKGDKKAANHYLTIFAKLVRATLNHSRAGTISLEDELQLLKNYLKMEQLRFKDRFDYQLELDEGVEPFEIEIPPMMVQPFVENAIIHGLSKKEEKGEVKLFFQLADEHLQVSITDNGVGIEQSRRLQKHGRPLHKSVGMTITKKRLELLSGQGQQGRVEAEELKDEAGKVLGTRVVVWIPLVDRTIL